MEGLDRTRGTWFAGLRYRKRSELSSVLRLRMGHCLVPSHLFRIDVIE